MRTGAADLTQGGILKKILAVAMPVMGTQLLQMTYNLTDMFWLGRMEDSVTAVAASGLAGMFLWLGMALLLTGRVGAEIGVSQNLGGGEPEAARQYMQQSGRVALILGGLYGLLLLAAAGPLVSLLQVREAEVFDSACAYLRIVAIAEPIVYLSAAISGGFNGAGRSGLSFFANAAGLIINMILDPLMIISWGWGVKGAAIATIIAQCVVGILMITAAKRHPKRPFSDYQVLGALKPSYLKQIFRWSLPMTLESGAFTALAMVVAGMVSSRFGANAVAVQRVGSQIESLSWLIGGGFSSAVTAFVGQNYGARKWARIRRGYRVSMAVLMAWEISVMLLLIFFGRALFSLFLQEPLLIQMGGEYLLILSACQPFMALEGICGGTFRGVGKTLPPSISSITSNLIRPGMCWLLSQAMGLNGFWLGITLSASFRGLMMFIWFSLYQRKMPREDGLPPDSQISGQSHESLKETGLPQP